MIPYFCFQITKKLSGGIWDTAAWMTNFGDELGQVLNSVLITAEDTGLEELCQGVVRRYLNAKGLLQVLVSQTQYT